MQALRFCAYTAVAIFFSALCSAPMDASARIHRDKAALLEFRRLNPCPETQSTSGKCPGWQIDHVEPLCAQGADRLENLQWLTTQEHKWKTRTDVRVCRMLRGAQ